MAGERRYVYKKFEMKFALGTKKEMVSIYDEAGNVHPTTAVAIEPMAITAIKTVDTDGYSAVQVGFGKQKSQRISKALGGHMKKGLGEDAEIFAATKEFRVDEAQLQEFQIGETISPSESFEEGEKVEVSGITKGKGFQGVVKRHGFRGGPRTHGQKHSERAPGSIGAGGVQKVIKGVRMAGRMGGDRVNVKNLKIVKIDKDNNIMYISGALPGRRGTLIEIRQIS